MPKKAGTGEMEEEASPGILGDEAVPVLYLSVKDSRRNHNYFLRV